MQVRYRATRHRRSFARRSKPAIGGVTPASSGFCHFPQFAVLLWLSRSPFFLLLHFTARQVRSGSQPRLTAPVARSEVFGLPIHEPTHGDRGRPRCYAGRCRQETMAACVKRQMAIPDPVSGVASATGDRSVDSQRGRQLRGPFPCSEEEPLSGPTILRLTP